MKAEQNKELSLGDFQQQVAEKYGMENDLDWMKRQMLYVTPVSQKDMIDEAAELYAQYCYEQGKKEGFFEGDKLTADLLNRYETKGWNEALHWVAEHGVKGQINMGVIQSLKKAILNGLKEE